MNDILIVLDIHGRTFWESVVDFRGNIIFLGDYAAPYPQENVTLKQTYENFLRIVDFKIKNYERSETSIYRGGFDAVGSPIWADISEYVDETEHFNDQIVQIVGHTLT